MNRTGHGHEIAPTATPVAVVAETASIAGESPIWSEAENCLYCVDHQGRKIHRYRPENRPGEKPRGRLETFDLPDIVTAIAPRRSGGLIIALHQDFAFFDPDSGRLEKIVNPEPDLPDNRFNDGKCDRSGRFWAGTMGKQAWDQPCGNLYRLGADLKPVKLVSGVRCSNGLDWSPDNRTFYFAESFAYRVHAYDFDQTSGALSNRRLFAALDPKLGAFPDGLTVDREGYVWNAQPVYGRITRYDPEGRIDRIVEIPASWCTSCIFGDADLGTIYVTSARESLSAAEIAEEPLSGAIFSFRPGVTGLPAVPFEG
jgi:sugar lactone lactonase YvrE